MRNRNTWTLVTTMLLASTGAMASEVTVPNTFQSGAVAVAAEVNGNFTAVATGVNDNDARITALETTIATLQNKIDALTTRVDTLETDLAATSSQLADADARLAAVESNSVLDLDGYLLLDSSGTYAIARFTGVNVQIVNGTGIESTINGLGNLIVGYDEPTTGLGFSWCSDPTQISQNFCELGGDIWAESQKSGSHNLIVGNRNSYTGYGGVVFGENNVINADGASVLGGSANMVRYLAGAIVGGNSNLVIGYSGAAILGGLDNETNAAYSSVVGGEANVASGSRSTVVGGFANSTGAGATSAVVSGGSARAASGTNNWVAGSLLETQ